MVRPFNMPMNADVGAAVSFNHPHKVYVVYSSNTFQYTLSVQAVSCILEANHVETG
jgi:hypothetical protein